MSQQQGKNLTKQEQSKFTQKTESKWWGLCSVFPLLFVLRKSMQCLFSQRQRVTKNCKQQNAEEKTK